LNSESTTLYEAIGGEQTVQKLVDAFYPRVEKDPDLSPLFQHGIQEIMRKQFMFLTQFLGGEPLYSNEFGPPQMRFRHLPFEITPIRAKAWLKCMREAMDEIGLEGMARDYFYERLTQVASIMVNTNQEDNE
jgi:hemoglobin